MPNRKRAGCTSTNITQIYYLLVYIRKSVCETITGTRTRDSDTAIMVWLLVLLVSMEQSKTGGFPSRHRNVSRVPTTDRCSAKFQKPLSWWAFTCKCVCYPDKPSVRASRLRAARHDSLWSSGYYFHRDQVLFDNHGHRFRYCGGRLLCLAQLEEERRALADPQSMSLP